MSIPTSLSSRLLGAVVAVATAACGAPNGEAEPGSDAGLELGRWSMAAGEDDGDPAPPDAGEGLASLRDLLTALRANSSQLWQGGEIARSAAEPLLGAESAQNDSDDSSDDLSASMPVSEALDQLSAALSAIDDEEEPAGAGRAAALAERRAKDGEVERWRHRAALLMVGDQAQRLAGELQAVVATIAADENIFLPSSAGEVPGNAHVLEQLRQAPTGVLATRLSQSQLETIERARLILCRVRASYHRVVKHRLRTALHRVHQGIAIYDHLKTWDADVLADPGAALRFADGLYSASNDDADNSPSSDSDVDRAARRRRSASAEAAGVSAAPAAATVAASAATASDVGSEVESDAEDSAQDDDPSCGAAPTPSAGQA